MTVPLPLTHVYNLARLSQAGDTVRFTATPQERTAIAGWSGVPEVGNLSAQIDLKKLSSSRFALEIVFEADVIQSCVVSMEAVPAHIERRFVRELHFSGARRGAKTAESATVTISDPEENEPPEEIANLQYDLAGPVLEEYVLSLDPYPRAPGAEFHREPGHDAPPQSPFAALKSFKSSS